jgi:hypothetical protein
MCGVKLSWDLRQGQLMKNYGCGSVSILKKAQPSSRVSVGFHTILGVDTVWSGRYNQISRRASRNAPEISYGEFPVRNRWSRR